MAEHTRIDFLAEGVARVTVTRADIGNASSPPMLDEISRCFEQLNADDRVRAIVFAAEGKHFSVGADFAFLNHLTSTPASEIKETVYASFQGAAKAIYRCRKATVALVQGAAITVGCELALACDFRIASQSARFQESWIRLGIMPPLGGLFLLPRLVGLGRAMDICLRGRPVGADEALRIGLVGECVPDAELEGRGLELAAELAALPPLAYASVKQALQRGLESSMEAEWQANVSTQALLLTSEDFREGLGAVSEKRSAKFLGK